ncbi:dihydrodipicolinate synthase family protein [Cohnella nanjingensis]|uniref:Dihydrodipicolinate synthase family protein n=1 Tax=Cohnella nanjingensis TaxID=1387779 RepID=A0A7X0RNJ9_9BACL|nr:dihydrodipicolinate synthase family protein [Cohnella nanjingensis]MBB6670814.1 dihydrodipicolinate synthase family protein [Cohnella nanjingensis]
MNPQQSEEIRGNWATLLLPVNEDDSIDFGRLQEEIDFLTEIGVDGIYSNGTAGEFYAQNEEEFEHIQDMLANACEKRGVPFQIGASHMSPQLSLSRIRKAVQWNPSAIQVILSDWYPLRDDEVISCLQVMAEAAAPIGIVLYNPPHAKRTLKPEMFAKVKAAVPNFVGIKVPGGDEEWYREMSIHARGVSVFVPGHTLATGYSRGAHGAYSNVACIHPGAAQKWYDSMKNRLEDALELEARIQRFLTSYVAPFITEHKYCNAACDKLLAAIGGWAPVGTRLRWPYRSIPETEAERLRPIAKEMIPEFFV